jgi:hypothetical protein
LPAATGALDKHESQSHKPRPPARWRGFSALYFQSATGTFYALDASNGSVLAQVVTNGQSSGPAISSGQIYVGTGDAARPFRNPALPLGPGAIVALGLHDRETEPALAARAVASRAFALDNPFRNREPIVKKILQDQPMPLELSRVGIISGHNGSDLYLEQGS